MVFQSRNRTNLGCFLPFDGCEGSHFSLTLEVKHSFVKR
jgi:hypothetical protein